MKRNEINIASIHGVFGKKCMPSEKTHVVIAEDMCELMRADISEIPDNIWALMRSGFWAYEDEMIVTPFEKKGISLDGDYVPVVRMQVMEKGDLLLYLPEGDYQDGHIRMECYRKVIVKLWEHRNGGFFSLAFAKGEYYFPWRIEALTPVVKACLILQCRQLMMATSVEEIPGGGALRGPAKGYHYRERISKEEKIAHGKKRRLGGHNSQYEGQMKCWVCKAHLRHLPGGRVVGVKACLHTRKGFSPTEEDVRKAWNDFHQRISRLPAETA